MKPSEYSALCELNAQLAAIKGCLGLAQSHGYVDFDRPCNIFPKGLKVILDESLEGAGKALSDLLVSCELEKKEDSVPTTNEVELSVPTVSESLQLLADTKDTSALVDEADESWDLDEGTADPLVNWGNGIQAGIKIGCSLQRATERVFQLTYPVYVENDGVLLYVGTEQEVRSRLESLPNRVILPEVSIKYLGADQAEDEQDEEDDVSPEF